MERTAAGSEGGGLRPRFRRHLRAHPELIPAGSRTVVAVSGGPDSMALLDLLRSAGRGSVLAAHFDHGLRPGSAGEAGRVVEWCDRRGIRRAAAGPPAPLDPDPAGCRRARYGFLEDLADQIGADRIATAHHADDQAETILFRLLRGTGPAGLRGMVPLDGRLVRPLLPFGVDELLGYAERRGLPYHRDPSNRDPAFARSRVRHRLLPALEARDPSVRGKLLRIGRLAARAEEATGRLTEEALAACRLPAAEGEPDGSVRLSRSRVRALDRELQARAVRRLARDRGVRLTRGGTRSAVQFIRGGRSGGRVDLGDGLRLGRDFDVLWIGRPVCPDDDRPLAFRVPGSGSGTARIGGLDFRIAWGRGEPKSSAAGGLPWTVPAAASAGGMELRVRAWRAGDRIRLPGGTRKLKDLFVDRRVPRSLRERVPVVAASSPAASSPAAPGTEGPGRVLWVPGLCRAAGPEETGTPVEPRGEPCWVTVAGTNRLAPGAS